MSSHFLTTLLSLLLFSSSYGYGHARWLPPSGSLARELLDFHNEVRAEVGVAPMSWSTTLANAATDLVTYQKFNNKCQMPDLRKSNYTVYGLNIVFNQGGMGSPVDVWVENKESWTYKQIVWRKNWELGCSQAVCKEAYCSSLTVCFYNAPIDVIPYSNCQCA